MDIEKQARHDQIVAALLPLVWSRWCDNEDVRETLEDAMRRAHRLADIAEQIRAEHIAASTVAGIVIAEKAEPTEGTT